MFTENPLLRGGPIFFCICYLWFSTNDVNVRVKIIMGGIACILGVLISVFCQSHVPIHVRPVYDNRLGLVNILKWNQDSTDKRIYSFPSDTATLYFALVTIVFLQSRKMGLLSFLWAVLTVGVCRVAVGVHYPSDILAGMILGTTLVLVLSTIAGLTKWLSKRILRYDPGQKYLNIFFVFLCLEAYSLFPGLSQIFYFFIQLLKGGHAG
ncbi:phosphatase PAP2 family protein [Mucilaginibacter sp. L3T2-6]|uniref:phosphatase PAP2 family protein n=1 Tax=Mucilaginibacter sp. L3T2-6 TaxID=3062491 RepID=UPI002675EEAF|nr:phosphatase PAP2 family protein [Mucilaginibacter sp. L3T2-6]